MNPGIWQRAQTIDRRVIYVILLLFIFVALFDKHLKLPIIPAKQTIDFYNAVQAAPSDKLVLVSGQWSPSTRGENQWQAQAIFTHLMRRRLKFAMIGFDPQNDQVTRAVVEPLAKQYHYVYGVDYIDWGFRPYGVFPQFIKSLANDIPGTVIKDRDDRPIGSFPIMRGVKNFQDIGLLIEITGSGTAEFWMGLVQGAHKTPFALACTAVMAPTYYPYLDSGQLVGMLTGIKGAGDYEGLLDTSTFGTRATGALSLVYALIILLIALGNFGYYMSKFAERKKAT